jgi:hypothetical protein
MGTIKNSERKLLNSKLVKHCHIVICNALVSRRLVSSVCSLSTNVDDHARALDTLH